MSGVLELGWPNLNVTTDTLLRTGRGILHSIVLNGVTTVGDIVVYDGVDATGRIVATLNVRTAVAISFQGMTFTYDAKLDTGLFIDITSSTFAGNITVMYS